MLRALEQLSRARQFAETGQPAAVVEFLGQQPRDELEHSPTLALLYGTAQAQLGRHSEAERWVDRALTRARERADRAIQARALNARGAMALMQGRIDIAAEYLTQALAEAERDGDHATVGRCSNNLGIINNLRGLYAQAIGSYTMAIAAFQQAGVQSGIAQAHHNLGITYRDQGQLARALEEADRAVTEAQTAGDRKIAAQAIASRAETRLGIGEADVALREAEHAARLHRELDDPIDEAQDLRIVANAFAETGDPGRAMATLTEVIDRAETLEHPLLAATAMRDLAWLLHKLEQESDAVELARSARVLFSQLGAEAEVRKLDALLS